jgi:hypothetical protein
VLKRGFRRLPVLLFFVVFLSFVSDSAKNDAPVVRSQWRSSPVVIDGLTGDWGEAGFSHDKRSGTDFAFRNDSQYLYILIVLNAPEASKALRASGIRIFGRPKKSGAPGSGVLFVAREVPAEAYIGWQVSQGAVLTEAEKAELRKAGRREIDLAFAINATGSIYGPIGRAARGPAPDFATASRDSGAAYEFRIPLASPDQVPGGVSAGPDGTLRLSFDWGGAENRELSTPASRERQTSASGYLSGTGRTWSQEFLDTFDSMSRPSSGSKKYSFSVQVKLAEPQ